VDYDADRPELSSIVFEAFNIPIAIESDGMFHCLAHIRIKVFVDGERRRK
jgi:hypothetical protein